MCGRRTLKRGYASHIAFPPPFPINLRQMSLQGGKHLQNTDISTKKDYLCNANEIRITTYKQQRKRCKLQTDSLWVYWYAYAYVRLMLLTERRNSTGNRLPKPRKKSQTSGKQLKKDVFHI